MGRDGQAGQDRHQVLVGSNEWGVKGVQERLGKVLGAALRRRCAVRGSLSCTGKGSAVCIWYTRPAQHGRRVRESKPPPTSASLHVAWVMEAWRIHCHQAGSKRVTNGRLGAWLLLVLASACWCVGRRAGGSVGAMYVRVVIEQVVRLYGHCGPKAPTDIKTNILKIVNIFTR